jgi:hypothetical protein
VYDSSIAPSRTFMAHPYRTQRRFVAGRGLGHLQPVSATRWMIEFLSRTARRGKYSVQTQPERRNDFY